MHSTRGRAHLLFEMLQQDPMKGLWKAEPVREALDLCLACKGCKGECPVNVDVATYKAEFLAHYYEGRPRPRHAYSMGLIPWWARFGSILPGLTNLMTQAPGLRSLMKRIGEIAPQRALPAFAPQTFQSWFRHRSRGRRGGTKVILWSDTFSNYFHPAIAAAAVGVLESAGFEVSVPAAR